MMKNLKVALLVIIGTFLLAVSSFSTSYDRGTAAALEQFFGFLLLGCAGGICVATIGDAKKLTPHQPDLGPKQKVDPPHEKK